ncbi:hypothetical protein QFC22_005323 [Naganishia vaughanmartiniae]|uniref:Uncharacterized protein n=1 Tax=Naganishia vaughanmartiniae TaxID=1424756 RepID=A0ACC2WUK9_9TREE|nr:hypothetical protein QFC22_005323 [Naganishia vaughanmartiniae]
MNILRNIASAALQSTGVTFPFQIGDRISLGPGDTASFDNQVIWDIRSAVKKDDGTPVTLFVFDVTAQSTSSGKDRKAQFQLAKNALKKLRTIRHPNILRYIDSIETETHIYIATERVTPLGLVLQHWEEGKIVKGDDQGTRKRGQEEWLAWGLKSITVRPAPSLPLLNHTNPPLPRQTALAFLNAPPLSQHHSLLLPSSIFITPALEWRLAGFEVMSGKEDPAGVAWAPGVGVGVAPGGVGERLAPEVKKGGWDVLKDADPAVTDTYLLALLIHTLYNPRHQPLPTLSSGPPTATTSGAIPRALFPVYKRMLNPNPRMRLSTTAVIPELEQVGFWRGNNLVELVDALDGFELASEGEKAGLLRRIKESIPSLPPQFLTAKILPSLLHSLSLPSAPSSAILPLVLAIGKDIPDEQRYRELVLEPVVRLYASPDRGTRMALLEGLAEYGDRLEKGMVNDKIWPHLITGFADTVAVIREATVKAIPIIAPKLSDRLLNNDLLRLLAKMQIDPEPSIRTNTCILLGRLAPLLGPNTKKKVLVAAFARSLKDSFVHARVAGLMALMATVEYYDKDDLAGKVLPNMSFTLVDREKLVRDQAFKAMQMFMARLEAAAEAMASLLVHLVNYCELIVSLTQPDTAIPENAANGQTYGPSTTTMLNGSHTSAAGTSLVHSATGAAGALAGWAIASLGKQLPVSEAHSSISATPAQVQYPLSVPNASSSGLGTSNTSGIPRSSTPSARSNVGKAGGMQLGASSAAGRPNRAAASTSLVDELAGEFEEDGDEVANVWGSGDLLDVNADEDDWSAFEEAPVPLVSEPRRSTTASQGKASVFTEDPWADPVPSLPNLSITKPRQPAAIVAPKPVRAKQPPPAAKAAPSPALVADEWNTAKESDWQEGTPTAEDKPSTPVNVSLAGLSKEEKEKEMARRREERKAIRLLSYAFLGFLLFCFNRCLRGALGIGEQGTRHRRARGGSMSPLHHSHINESSLHGSPLHEPDSELRDALQRVARDLELKTQQQKQRQQGRELHDEATRKDHVGHEGDDMQVEDILDHAALEGIQGDDMATFQSATPEPDASHRGQVSIRQSMDPHLIPTGDFHARMQSHTPTLASVSADATSRIMLASLKGIPSMGFMKYLDDWLEARGLKSADAPSPVVEAWSSLDSDQRSRHEARARSALSNQRAGKTSDEADHQSTSSQPGPSASKPRRASSRIDVADADEQAASMIGRTFSETEKSHIGNIISNIVQELDVLYQTTGTNYLLLSAPVFQAPDDFPVLAHSPPAASFWQSLRGGPGTNLTKFLALSHPAVTSRRLAIPTGARSLDVKSRLNANMRQMIREASNVADAEMKWTRPESLIQIYGVKIVGWPMGAPGTEHEMVPMRNPSNNSVAQNKLLLQRIEDGILRVELASDEDRSDVTGANTSRIDRQEAPARSHSGASDASQPATHSENNHSMPVEGENVYEDATASELLDRASDSVRRGRGRPPKLRGMASNSRSKYRSKSLLTLNPDGSIRPGGLDGKRKPGRPRKTVPDTPVEVPLASTRFEYHVHQQRSSRDRHPSSEDQVQTEDVVQEPVDPQSLYIQQEELGEASSEMVMGIIGPSLETPLEHVGEADENQYTANTSIHNEQQRTNGVHQQSLSDHLPSPLDQALSHIEYYQVTGPNFDNHSSHEVPVSRSHNLSNIAPHFPLPPPEDVHVGSHHTSIGHEEQQYISDFTTRMPTINPYNTHFTHTADQGAVEHESWHEQRNSEDASTESADGGTQVSLRDIQNHHVEDNPDIVDGIDMEAAFGNHELSSEDSVSDRSDIGDMSDAQMRAFLVSQPPLHHGNEEDIMAGQPGKRKVDEMGHGIDDEHEQLDRLSKRSKCL